jgi:hypothetical protein
MIRKSFKYSFIAFVNAMILTLLLAIWTDELELKLNQGIRFLEFLKIIGFTIAVLISMRMLVSYFRNIGAARLRNKMRITIPVTLMVSSYLYITYSLKVVKNVIIDGKFRRGLASKISTNDRPNGSAGNSLSLKEYKETIRFTRLPALPESASNITYDYYYDGFLPDYSVELAYDMPLSARIDTVDYSNGDFSKSQSYKILTDRKRVTFEEIRQ